MKPAWQRVRAFSRDQREQYREYVKSFEKLMDRHLTEAECQYLVSCLVEMKPPSKRAFLAVEGK